MKIGMNIVLRTMKIVKIVVLMSKPSDFDAGLTKLINLLLMNPKIQFVKELTTITRNCIP